LWLKARNSEQDLIIQNERNAAEVAKAVPVSQDGVLGAEVPMTISLKILQPQFQRNALRQFVETPHPLPPERNDEQKRYVLFER